jgi:hypothetical protein
MIDAGRPLPDLQFVYVTGNSTFDVLPWKGAMRSAARIALRVVITGAIMQSRLVIYPSMFSRRQ